LFLSANIQLYAQRKHNRFLLFYQQIIFYGGLRRFAKGEMYVGFADRKPLR